MAIKLYPPDIKGTIPAFTGTVISVPFSMNRAVNKYEVAGFSLKIKTVQSNIVVGTFEQIDEDMYNIGDSCYVNFDLESTVLNVGQYYKLQLAYISYDGVVGYYSTVGVTKYTTEPEVTILGLVDSLVNMNSLDYTGVYSQSSEGDRSEKLYSSVFNVYDKNNNLVHTSGNLLHNASKDNIAYEANEEYTVDMAFEENAVYYIQYVVTTSNNYVCSSPKYKIMEKESIPTQLEATLEATLSFDDAYIDLNLKPINNSTDAFTGSFVILRAASNDDYIWREIHTFDIKNQIPEFFLCRDFAIEQGITYKYAIRQYNDYGVYSSRIESNEILADFEDMFIFDGERQLKIRFNPGVSSFKSNIQENTVETIGSQYPFVFRNGRVNYKEFPITGLISHKMDDNKMFSDMSLSENYYYNTTDLTTENIHLEREFKLEVLNWLNNGKEKLFKSATEGNYIVRILNISMSPNDTLGRMLHTFSSTAYEVAECSYKNLINFNILQVDNSEYVRSQWMTIELAGHDYELDELLLSARKNYENQNNLIINNIQYQRILNNDADLAALFSSLTDGTAIYVLSQDAPQEAITNISLALGRNVSNNRIITSEEYQTIVDNYEDLYDDYIEVNSSTTNDYYVLNYEDMTEEVLEQLENFVNSVTYAVGNVNQSSVYSISVTDMLPGTTLELVKVDDDGVETVETIVIGATGNYYASFDDPYDYIRVPATYDSDGNLVVNGISGSITYEYQPDEKTYFDIIQSIEITEHPIQQFLGTQSKIYYDREDDEYKTTDNLIEAIENEKTSILQIYSMFFKKRDLQNVFIKDSSFDTYYEDMDCTIVMTEFNPYYIYQICNGRFDYTYQNVLWEKDYVDSNFKHGYYVDADGKWIKDGIVYSEDDDSYIYEETGEKVESREEIYAYPVDTGYLLDGNSLGIYENAEDLYNVTINNDTISLFEIEEYQISNFETDIDVLKFGNGVVCELSYQTRDITYTLESSEASVIQALNEYEEVKEYGNSAVTNMYYNLFIDELAKQLRDYERRNSV